MIDQDFIKESVFDKILSRRNIFLEEKSVYPTRLYIGGHYFVELQKELLDKKMNLPLKKLLDGLEGMKIYDLEIKIVNSNILEIV